jgi:pyruvate/2-oxoglutarate dehydrogenase complex dihydrolipoamide dehydrogenase (E3) component
MRFGVKVPPGVEADFPVVMERLRRIRARISPHDSAARFTGLGVDVFLGHAAFSGPDTVTVGEHTLRFKRAVITTGARPLRPEIAGMAEAGFLTNETVFNLTNVPRRLAVVGGGPIGCELAQAFQRFGAEVMLFHKHRHLLDREDPDAAAIVQQSFVREGVHLALNSEVKRVELRNDGKLIHSQTNGTPAITVVDAILVSAGRQPNIHGLNLHAVGVEYDPRLGVRVNDRLQTTNPRIYAAGDVCMAWKFTHAADFADQWVVCSQLA